MKRPSVKNGGLFFVRLSFFFGGLKGLEIGPAPRDNKCVQAVSPV